MTPEEAQKELERRRAIDPVWCYQPIASFQTIISTTAQDIALECANQMGKSTLLQWTVAALARGIHPNRPSYGPTRGAVVVPGRTQAVDWTSRLLKGCRFLGALSHLADKPFIPAREMDGPPTYAHGSSAGKYAAKITLKNGSEIFFFLSGDERSWRRMEGWTFDWVVRDEFAGSENMGATVSRGLVGARSSALPGADGKIPKPCAGLYLWATTSTDPNEEWESHKVLAKTSERGFYCSAKPEEADDYVRMEVREAWAKTLSADQREVRAYGRASAASQITIYAQHLHPHLTRISRSFTPSPEDNVGLVYDPGWKDPCGIFRFWIPRREPSSIIIDQFHSYRGGTRMEHVQTMLSALDGRTAAWIICDPSIQKTESNGVSYYVQFIQDLQDARVRFHEAPIKGRNRNEDGLPLVVDYITGKDPERQVYLDPEGPGMGEAIAQLMAYRWKQDQNGNVLKTPYSSRSQRDESPDLLKYLCSRYPYWIDYGPDPAAARPVTAEAEESIDPVQAHHQAGLEESARMVDEWKREQLGQTTVPWSRSSGWSF